jgi:hypothetical protein
MARDARREKRERETCLCDGLLIPVGCGRKEGVALDPCGRVDCVLDEQLARQLDRRIGAEELVDDPERKLERRADACFLTYGRNGVATYGKKGVLGFFYLGS